MKQAGKGAEAELLECRFMGEEALCKRRGRKQYRVHELDYRLRSERTRKEARILSAAKQKGVRCPLVKHVDETRKELFINKIDGILLRNALSKDALAQAGKQLALLHEGGIVHGDSTASNFMVEGNGTVWLIDFGLAEYSTELEEQATDLLLFKKSVSQKQFQEFLDGYSRNAAVLKQLEEIEKRGRYVVRAMAK
ncbi:Kae1-associated serine/threonine protein kinase [Candidatus Micrarchaeota archaeon]|nr:Kae1-associated serine/threonine protein kinase [Candidatus Micrarchaeota archaeon]